MKRNSIATILTRNLYRFAPGVIRRSSILILLLSFFAIATGVPGASSAEPGDSFLAFHAQRDGQMSSLYRTDGTPGGTKNILDLVKSRMFEWPIRTSFHNASRGAILVVGQSMYPREAGVYVFDATSRPLRLTGDAALRLATDIRPIRMIEGRLFFVVDNAIIFASDGTAQGTRRFTGRFFPALVDIFPFKSSHVIITNERTGNFPQVSSRIYARDASSGRIDLIYDFGVDGGSIGDVYDYDWKSAVATTNSALIGTNKDQFIFSRSNGRRQGLWISDGTPAGTRLLASTSENRQLSPRFVELGARVLFLGFTSSSGWEPWVTDGTPQGTRQLRDIRPGYFSSRVRPEQIVVHAGKAYFLATPSSPSALERGLWVTDGTPGGTRPIRTEVSGQTIRLISSEIYEDRTNELALIGNEIFFAGTLREGTCSQSPNVFCRYTTDLYSFDTVTAVTRKRAAASQHICRYGRTEIIGGDYGDIRAFGSKLFFSSTGKGASSRAIGCEYENRLNAEPWVFETMTGEARQLLEITAGPRGSAPVPIGNR